MKCNHNILISLLWGLGCQIFMMLPCVGQYYHPGDGENTELLVFRNRFFEDAPLQEKIKVAKEIAFADVRLEENQLSILAKAESMEHLGLSGHHLRPDDLKPLLDLPPILKTLNISDAPRISDESILGEVIAKQINLERLILDHIPISDVTLEHVATLPKLKKLTLWQTPHVTGNGLYTLSKSQSLQESLEVLILYNGYEFCDFDDMSFLHRSKNETRDGDEEDEEELIRLFDFLGSFKNLRILSMGGNVWGIPWEDPYHFLHALTKLEKLLVPEAPNLTDDVLEKYISRMPDLQILDLGGTGITDQGVVHLFKLPKLKSLSIYDTEISDEGLKVLAEHPVLEYVSVNRFDKTKITREGVEYLSSKIEERFPWEDEGEFPHINFNGGVTSGIDDYEFGLDDLPTTHMF